VRVIAARIDGLPASMLPLSDRGLAYGDGLFETILLHRGRPVWWAEHLDRMAAGARALGIAAPASHAWQADLAALCDDAGATLPPRAVVKLILTRGDSARGYAPDAAAVPRRIARLQAAPADDPGWRRDGIAVRWCDLRLSRQPRLAGFKHLNRLEQVLARAEWNAPAIQEGLLRRDDGAVVSATAANLFVVAGDRLLTPRLDLAGVAGICRRFLLARAGAVECELDEAAVHAADELFLTNSLRGILPIARLGNRSWPRGPFTRALIERLAAAEPAFDFETDR
jgi:4-amino-4-deoxychorismate lyase